MAEAESILKGDTLQTPCVVLTGWHYPVSRMYRTVLNRKLPPDYEILELMTKEQLLNAIQEGKTVYYTPGVEALLNDTYGYSISAYPQAIYLRSQE